VTSWTTPPPERDGAPAAKPARAEREVQDLQHGEHGEHHHLHLPAGAHVADRRGLTAMGAVAIGLAIGLIGAVIDVRTGRGLRTTFAVCFVSGSALAALLAHREDLKATIVMPPLTYCALALIGAGIGHTGAHGSFMKQQALELVSSLISGAPVLYAATGVALLIALVRLRTARQP
jgi:hypothetical protein